MRRVLIVDDEAIVRVTLRSMVRWENYGMEVVADCNSGQQALDYLREHSVELLITDVKMPEMSGIELLRRLGEENRMPVTLMLSGYNEFELVREAFRLGAHDYILKADLNPEQMDGLLTRLNRKYWDDSQQGQEEQSPGKGERSLKLPEEGVYGAAVLEVDDFLRQAARFGEDLKEMMEKPMMELVHQIPGISRRGKLLPVQPGHFIFLYTPSDQGLYHRDMKAVIHQMQTVWRDFMNLSVSAAVVEMTEAAELSASLEMCERLLVLAPLSGRASVVTSWEHGGLENRMGQAASQYGRLLSHLYEADEKNFEQEKRAFFQSIGGLERQEAVQECLCLIALLAMKFREYDEDFFCVFPEEVNYYEKFERLQTMRELEVWMNNYFRWELEYLGNRLEGRHNDIMLRARRFIADNYASSELSLGAVAAYVGLNEKYFTTRFTKSAGMTFRDYVTELRLDRAKQLMNTTDLRMYEISERVGYNNVEHFTRMFKKKYGISPSDYKKQNV